MHSIDGKQRWRDYVAEYPNVARIVSERNYGEMLSAYATMKNTNGAKWRENITGNLDALLNHHRLINADGHGIARGKMILAIGAGPSLNNNWPTILNICEEEGRKPWADKRIVTVVCNHQLRRLLKYGVHPDFVIAMDTGAYTVSQTDIGDAANRLCLLAAIEVDPATVAAWHGPIRFLVPEGDVGEVFAEVSGSALPDGACIPTGGNCLNTTWSIALALWKADAWMCVGNDLGFLPAESIEEKRLSFYADANYADHKRRDRDEVVNSFNFPGFVANGRGIEFVSYETTPEMYGYKVWLELNAELMRDKEFLTINCSESGILGVQNEQGTYILYDDLNPRWQTRKLADTWGLIQNARN